MKRSTASRRRPHRRLAPVIGLAVMATAVAATAAYAATGTSGPPAPSPNKASHLLRPVPNPNVVPPGVDPRLWNARPVQAMGPLQVSSANASQVLWGTTDRGRQLESTDTGHTWTPANLPAGPSGTHAYGTSFSGSSGWLSTGTGLYGTTDGGTTWQELPAFPSPKGDNITLPWVQRLSRTGGWAITSLDALEKTSTGGESWVDVSTPATQVEAACFTSLTDGLIATDAPTAIVFATHDGGKTWSQVFATNSTALKAALTCDTTTDATLRLDLSVSMQGERSETWAAAGGWAGSWTPVAGNYPASSTTSQHATVDGTPDGSRSPARVAVAQGRLNSVGVTGAGQVEVGTAAIGSGHVGSIHMADVGTIAPSSFSGLATGEYDTGAQFLSKTTGYVFASSQETGLVLFGATHSGGSHWTTTTVAIPAS